MPEGSSFNVPSYRLEAVFLRDLAQVAKSAEAKQELLTLAIAYERLAERRKTNTTRPDSLAGRMPSQPILANRRERAR